MTEQSIRIVGEYLRKTCRILARSCAPEDKAAALAFAELLREPLALVQPTATAAPVEVPEQIAEQVPA